MAVGLGLAVFLTVLGMNRLGLFQSFELRAYDLLLSLRLNDATHPPRVTLITVTDADIDRLQRWPIADQTLSKLLHRLISYHPRAIGVDLYRDLPVPPGREALAETLTTHQEIIVAQKFGDEASRLIPAPSILKNPEQIGCNDIVIDADGVVRRGLLYLGYQAPPCYSMGLRLALLYLSQDGISEVPDPKNPEILQLGKSLLPPLEPDDGGYVDMEAAGYQILLDFRTPALSLRRYTLSDALDGRLKQSDIEGKIVIVGTESESVKDYFFVPQRAWYEGSQVTVGAAIHGLLADQLIRAALEGKRPIRTLSEDVEVSWLTFWCLLGALIGSRNRPLSVFIPAQCLGVLINAAVVYGLFRANVWFPLLPSAIGWLLSTTFITAWGANRERKDRRILMTLFGKHVDPRIAEEIWRQRRNLLSGGSIAPKKMVATVFFSDLAGFTAIAESLEPEILIAWLNEYLVAMTGVINQHGGVVIRFIGDAIMAGFGVPIPRDSTQEVEQDALNAAKCALAIQQVLARLNRDWQSRGLPAVGMRIGINTGLLLAGSLGNQDRMEYTIHGDIVNTAARLESYEKERFRADYFVSPCRILISEETNKYLRAALCSKYLGSIELKHKSNATKVFELTV